MEKWQDPKTIGLWILIAIFFVSALLMCIILLIRMLFKKMVMSKLAAARAHTEYQRNLLDTIIETQEKERKRIALDLHDAVIGKLIAVKLYQETGPGQHAKAITLIDESISTARQISHALSPPLLEYTSMAELIKEILQPWDHKIDIRSIYDLRNEHDHPNDFKIQLLRVLQEVVTNTVKHAQASLLRIHFRYSQRWTALGVTDNGIGYDMGKRPTGSGMRNIETRIQYLNGYYSMRSKMDHGSSALFLFKNQTMIS